MGFTELWDGNVWNTFPLIYFPDAEKHLYFDLDEDSRIFHFMGTPEVN